MEIKGILKKKEETQFVSDKFSKREFILTIDPHGKYPQHVAFQCTQDKCNLLDNISEGTELTVHFNLRGREWNGPQGVKYFNTLEAWRIDGNSAASGQPSAPTFDPTVSDDLPF